MRLISPKLSQLLLGSTSAFVINIYCVPTYADDAFTDSLVTKTSIGENTENVDINDDVGEMGFSISVDGDRIAGDEQPVDEQRKADIALDKLDIQVKFDGLGVTPTLNVATTDLRHSYNEGEVIAFRASSNYPAWIYRSEIRIYEEDRGLSSSPVEIVEIDVHGNANWTMPTDGDGEYLYVLRVYDDVGRFDQTLPLGLSRSSSDFPTHETSPTEQAVAAGDGEDRTAFRNIPVYGGAVTVYGQDIPHDHQVSVIRESVAVDNENNFVIQRILPPGTHNIGVTVSDTNHNKVQISRSIHIPENEWFFVGLADLTIGRRFGDEELVAAGPGEYEQNYSKGRLAFYLKGKIKGRYILTAAADTGEDDFDTLFTNLDAKDPRQLLRRIDPDKYYPVYGDDSTSIEDAPTSGKFYIKLEKGDSHAMWGNYKTSIKNTEYARNERGLYGAHALLRSENVTTHGERVSEIEAYAAQPGTLPQRDTLRGTGGSVYFLKFQDITRGSETITIEIRDPVTGIVSSREVLQYGEDYDIDYVQGVVILNSPLASTANGSSLVSNGALGDDIVNLVVQYEYTPALGNVDGYSFGGRAQVWINDYMRLGVSGLSENTGPADHEVLGADLKIRLGENSYFEAELAESNGPGFGGSNSVNGGLTINNTLTSGVPGRRARAYRGKLHIDVSDIDPEKKGQIGVYYERREAGFSSISNETTVDQRIWGAFANVEIDENLRYRFGYEDYSDGAGVSRREGDGELEFTVAPDLKLALGAKHTQSINPAVLTANGRRTDVAAKLTHEPDEDRKSWIFGQATVSRSGTMKRNDRIGVGAEVRVSEKVSLNGEVSWGTSGWGGEAGIKYDPTPDDHYYFGYRLDPLKSQTSGTTLLGSDSGTVIAGARHRYNDMLSTYMENNYDMFGKRRSLTTTYGVTYTPDALWTVDGGFEYGDVVDPFGASLERIAVSASVAYNDEDTISWYLKGEARHENSLDPAKDRDTYLFSAGASVKYDENWRFLANIDAALSESNQSSILDGDYIEASLGYAYRPIDNDRFNALLKYTFLYDLPGPNQVTANGVILGPAQRSHIFSADFNYDVDRHLTIGGKYGFRYGEVSTTRAASDFVTSSAHLGVLRADWHVVKNWDLLLEGRILHTPEIDTTDFGALAAIYRHIGNNMKIGVGYNFGRFSDDLSDLTYDDGGLFLNVVGKF